MLIPFKHTFQKDTKHLRQGRDRSTYKHWSSTEHVRKGIVDEIEEGGCIEVSITGDLAGKEGELRSSSKEAPKYSI